MIKRISILYKSGKEDLVELKVDEKGLQSVAEVVNVAFRDNVGGVIRLNDEQQSNFVNLSEVSRIKFE